MAHDPNRPLQAGGTDPDAAEHALAELYRLAGLEPPGEVVWAESPVAAARRTWALLHERAGEVRRWAAARLAGSEGHVPCLCSWCRGAEVTEMLYPPSELPEVRTDRLRLAEQTTMVFHRAIENDLGRPYPDPFHRRSYRGPGLRPSVVWPTNPWGIRFHTDPSARVEGGRAERRAAWNRLACTAGWWLTYAGFAVLSARPVAAHHQDGRLHHLGGPAVEFMDGWAMYAVEGMEVDPAYFEPGHPTLDDVVREPNLEIRRALIEMYGHARFAAEAGGRVVHSDEAGTLWDIRGMRLVEVVDATPRPDGSRRTYWLHVPPDTTSAQGAVAWTFGLTSHTYRPEVET